MKSTIAAIATPAGRGGVGIIRVSGPHALNFAEAVTGKKPTIRQATVAEFRDEDGQTIDEGILLFFQAPNSFTGEDVIEFQGHGSPVALDLLLKRLYQLGALPAKPGEFSERAFLNDKMDLVQAESIADLIEAASERASRLAVKNLKGAFSKRIHLFQEDLTQLRVYVEAAIDFPEEEIDFLGDGKILKALSARIDELTVILKQAKQGVVLTEGLTVVLAGYPNAGKSTLLNCLSGKETAIVTEIPGTTRDVMREQILIEGMPIHIIDTAGLRESTDPIEQEGIRRAWREIEEADHVLLLVDIDYVEQVENIKSTILAKIKRDMPCTIVVNKMDKLLDKGVLKGDGKTPVFFISAKYEQGIEQLRSHLSQVAGLEKTNLNHEETFFMARRRHLDALERALEHLTTGKNQLVQHKAGELLAEDLRQAQKSLSDITGEFSSDDLLGKIFSSFCIGK
jgi:tRNA modification GTPase